MAYTYAKTGPPFSFLGTVSESQWQVFKTWVQSQSPQLTQTQLHHQVRAQQLRKTQGLLEKFYSTENEDALEPTFQKDAWKPPTGGYWAFANRDDHAPAMAVGKIKKHLQPRLQRIDEGIFHMNHLRSQIERQEDLAQYASEGPDQVKELLAKVDTLFQQPEYQAALVKDLTDLYKGEPRFRVHPLDTPTAWERMQQNHGRP